MKQRLHVRLNKDPGKSYFLKWVTTTFIISKALLQTGSLLFVKTLAESRQYKVDHWRVELVAEAEISLGPISSPPWHWTYSSTNLSHHSGLWIAPLVWPLLLVLWSRWVMTQHLLPLFLLKSLKDDILNQYDKILSIVFFILWTLQNPFNTPFSRKGLYTVNFYSMGCILWQRKTLIHTMSFQTILSCCREICHH